MDPPWWWFKFKRRADIVDEFSEAGLMKAEASASPDGPLTDDSTLESSRFATTEDKIYITGILKYIDDASIIQAENLWISATSHCTQCG
jgi:hypothetical protein